MQTGWGGKRPGGLPSHCRVDGRLGQTNKNIQEEIKKLPYVGSQVCGKSHGAGRSSPRLDRSTSSGFAGIAVNLPMG